MFHFGLNEKFISHQKVAKYFQSHRRSSTRRESIIFQRKLSKCYKIIGFIKNLSSVLPRDALLSIFESFIRLWNYNRTETTCKKIPLYLYISLNLPWLWSRVWLAMNKKHEYFSIPDHHLAENLILIAFGLWERSKRW